MFICCVRLQNFYDFVITAKIDTQLCHHKGDQIKHTPTKDRFPVITKDSFTNHTKPYRDLIALVYWLIAQLEKIATNRKEKKCFSLVLPANLEKEISDQGELFIFWIVILYCWEDEKM